MTDIEYRIEHDTMGEVRVPKDALYAAQTQRAKENFPISSLRFPRRFVQALGLVKGAAAKANAALGSLAGGRLAQRVDPQRLNLAFTSLLVLVAGYTAAQNVPLLLR